MDIHGNINLRNNSIINLLIATDENFPAVPRPGQVVFKDKILYICTELLGDLPVWVPMTKSIEMYRFTQSTAAIEWVVEHNLNMNTVFVQVYDENGRWIVPDYISTSVFNRVSIGFNTPMIGTVIIMRGETLGAAPPIFAFDQEFVAQSVWVVNHSLGYNPIVRVIVGTHEVQPQSIVYDSNMQLTVTFSSPQTGSVRCV